MSQPTVNAYYDPQENDINFPAGILQPPFWDNKMDDAVTYGAIGAVIGHELTHAFDDEGRQFDAQGNLRDWWTEADAKAFGERAQCLKVKEYSWLRRQWTTCTLNGEFTLLGGEYCRRLTAFGWPAWRVDGYARRANSPQARRIHPAACAWFLGFAQVRCENK